MDATKKESFETGITDPEEGTITFTDASSLAPSSEDHVSLVPIAHAPAPERKLRRSAATRALPGLVLHTFQIDKDGKVEPFENAYAGLEEALSIEVLAPSNDNNHKKKITHTPAYWVDIDADERDRLELNEWIERLNLGVFVTDQITKPVEGTKKVGRYWKGIDRHIAAHLRWGARRYYQNGSRMLSVPGPRH